MYVCMYVYMCMCVCVYIYIYIYIYICIQTATVLFESLCMNPVPLNEKCDMYLLNEHTLLK